MDILHNKLKPYIKKMSARSMYLYYGLMILFGSMLIFLFIYSGEEEEYLYYAWGCLLFCIIGASIIYSIVNSRRKEAWKSIYYKFDQLGAEKQKELIKTIQEMPKKQLKKGFLLTPEITFVTNLNGIQAIRTDNILWVYKKIYTFVPFYRHYSICIRTMDWYQHIYEVGFSPIWAGKKKNDICENIMHQLQKYYPGVFLGYSNSNKQMFIDNHELMKKLYMEKNSSQL